MMIVSPLFLKILTFNSAKVNAMAIWPIIIFKNIDTKQDSIILNHEKIHHRQQLELVILPFYVLYFSEYFVNLFKYKFVHHQAYMNISFEREAYTNQNNPQYLSNRKFLNHFKYLYKQ